MAAPLHTLPVEPGWGDPSNGFVLARARSRATKIDRVLEEIRLQQDEPERVRLRLRAALGAAVEQAAWTPGLAPRADVFVSFPRATTSTVWRVPVGGRGIVYPSAASHRNLDPDLVLHAPPTSSAVLPTGNAHAFLLGCHLGQADERIVNALRGNDEHWVMSVLDWLRQEDEGDTVSLPFRRRSFVHPDGRRWTIRAGDGEVELTIEDEDGAIERRRPCADAVAEAAALIADQLADGFTEVTPRA